MKNPYLNGEFFSKLETLAFNLQKNLTGYFGGKHLTSTYGQTVEFADYREYMLGDDIRRIDWNLYSRFEKHFIKLFTDERQMHVQIFLDCSASMGKEDKEKGDYAVAIAGALGFLSIHNMDKLSFKLIRNGFAEDSTGLIVGKNKFYRAIHDLENVNFDDDSEISTAIINSPNQGSSDGITIIISDFLTDNDWKQAVDYLIYKKRQVMLIQVLTPQEIAPEISGRMNLIDSESVSLIDDKNMKLRITRGLYLAYEQAYEAIMDDIKSFCSSRGTTFVQVRTDESIEKSLFNELFKLGIMS